MLRGLADKVGMNVIVGCARIDLNIKPPCKPQDVGLRQAGADDRTSKVAGNLPDRPTSRAIGRIQLVSASAKAFAFVHVCICQSSPQLQYAEPLRLKIQSQGNPTSALHTMAINKLAGLIKLSTLRVDHRQAWTVCIQRISLMGIVFTPGLNVLAY